jgi:hypothetical protein
MIEHDQYTAVLRAEQFPKHGRSIATPNLAAYEDGVRERLESATGRISLLDRQVHAEDGARRPTMWFVGDRASDRYGRPRGRLLHGC